MPHRLTRLPLGTDGALAIDDLRGVPLRPSAFRSDFSCAWQSHLPALRLAANLSALPAIKPR